MDGNGSNNKEAVSLTHLLASKNAFLLKVSHYDSEIKDQHVTKKQTFTKIPENKFFDNWKLP